MAGTIIGAGVLGIPYVFAQAGFFTGLLVLLVLGIFVLLTNLCVGEIVLRTKGDHQLTGYASIYLGNWGRHLMMFAMIVGTYGALMAYTIGEGRSLAELFGGNPWLWSIGFFTAGSIVVYSGIRAVGASELVLVGTKLAVFIIVIALMVFSKTFDPALLSGFDLTKVFVPYGVILFAFLGAIAIPEMAREMKEHKNEFRKAIVYGSILPFIVYLLFAVAVIGITGLQTTEVANIGVGRALGTLPLVLINLFAVLAMATSFIALGLGLKEMYQYDYGWKHLWAFSAVAAVPILLILAGIQSFILILGVSGALAGGLEGVILMLAYWKAKSVGKRAPEYSVEIGPAVVFILSIVYIIGAAVTILKIAV